MWALRIQFSFATRDYCYHLGALTCSCTWNILYNLSCWSCCLGVLKMTHQTMKVPHLINQTFPLNIGCANTSEFRVFSLHLTSLAEIQSKFRKTKLIFSFLQEKKKKFYEKHHHNWDASRFHFSSVQLLARCLAFVTSCITHTKAHTQTHFRNLRVC